MKLKELLKRLKDLHKVVEGAWDNPNKVKTAEIVQYVENELFEWIVELEKKGRNNEEKN